jgi:hypothetical protein
VTIWWKSCVPAITAGAASTQNQALASLLFLYEQVLEKPLDRIEGGWDWLWRK